MASCCPLVGKASHNFSVILAFIALVTAGSVEPLIQDEPCIECSTEVSLLQSRNFTWLSNSQESDPHVLDLQSVGGEKHPVKLRPQVQTGKEYALGGGSRSFVPNLSHRESSIADHQLFFSPASGKDYPGTSSELLRPVHDLILSHFPEPAKLHLIQALDRVDVTFLRNRSRGATLMSSLWLAPVCCGTFLFVEFMGLLAVRHAFRDRLSGPLDDEGESTKADDSLDPPETRLDPNDVEVANFAETLLTENSGMKPQAVGVFGLYRFATPRDILMLCVGILFNLCSLACGPYMIFLNADILDAFTMPNDDGSPIGSVGPHSHRQQRNHRIVYILVALAAFKFVVSMLGSALLMAASMSMSRRVKAKGLEALLRKDVGWYDSNPPAELISRFSRDNMLLSAGAGDITINLLMSVGNVVFSLGFACYQSYKLTMVISLVGIVCVPVVSLAISLLKDSEERKSKHMHRAGARAFSAVSSIRTVKAFNGYAREQKSYEERLKDAAQEGLFYGCIQGCTNAAFQMQTAACMAIALFVGFIFQLKEVEGECWRVDPPYGHCLTGGAVYSVTGLVAAALSTSIPNIMADLTQATNAAGRVYALIDYKPKIGNGGSVMLDAPAGQVEYKGVSFAYPTRPQKVLKEVDITVPAGSTVAFVGPSGSGKSTLVNLILRFHEPLPGSIILFDGKDISTMNLAWLRRQIGLVEQEPVLYSGTVASNIQYGLETAVGVGEVERAAKDANAHIFLSDANMFPDGYRTRCGEGGIQLSGGQKQRVAIARALLRKPKVLLLDEATSALDTQSEKIVQATLDLLISSSSDQARTIMLIAQRLSTVTAANKIYVLDAGRVVQSGTHAELLHDTQGTYAKLYTLQSRGIKESAEQMAGRPEQSQSEELTRQTSGSSTSKNVESLSQTFEVDIAETEEFQAASISRIRALCKEDTRLYVVGIASLVVMSTGPALNGVLMGSLMGFMTGPPASQNEQGIWVTTYQRDQLATSCTFVVLMMLAAGLVCSFTAMTAFSSFHAAAEGVIYRVRSKLFKSILRQDNAWFDKPIHNSGSVCDALATQADQIKYVSGFGLANYTEMIISLLSCIVAALFMCWQLSLVLAGLQLLQGIPICIMVGAPTWDDHTAAQVVSEAVTNIRISAAYNLGERLVQEYLKLLDVQLGHEWRFRLRQTVSSSISQSLATINLAGCVFAGSELVNLGWIDPVPALVCCFILGRIGGAMQSAANWVAGAQVSRRSFGHIFKTLDAVENSMMVQTEQGSELTTVEGRLELRDVNFYYPQRLDAPVLQNLNLVCEPNTTTALVGPSGNGKSTVIALLERYYDPVEGAVFFDGVDIKTLKLTWLRQQMGLVQQEPVLFEGSIAENIAYGWQGYQKPKFELIEAAARAANAHDFIAHFPSGYDTNCGRKGLQLSGGQKQRISIARALFLNPRVLLLDEATSALDSESERVVQEALEGLMVEQQRTTVVIAHRLSTIANSDQICVIKDGRIVESHRGKPGEAHEVLKAKRGEYYKLLSTTKAEKQNV
eukprot:TRINITY_DN28786_c0_g2_i1.p1 TRINITY_DN28786_c0_g2~~TRINITY_DN28786_c0_g2_i1.p1  ORF type:complete len:1523 (-),score=261.76 TRINITY_DN28786_c0_g2_i1:253-4821(-)